jgi:hypothetical protein
MKAITGVPPDRSVAKGDVRSDPRLGPGECIAESTLQTGLTGRIAVN